MDEVQTSLPASVRSSGSALPRGDEPIAPEPAAGPAGPAAPRRGIGVVSLILALAMVASGVVAIAIGATPDATQSLAPAVTALGFSVLAAATGLVAVIANRGRALGVIALVVAVVLNPFLFTQALGWLGSL